MVYISKEKSFLIKGIVIVMMIFLHLFNGDKTASCISFLYVGDEPFAKWLSHACGPVSFFLLLSGYGLTYTYDKVGICFDKQVKRIFKLYAHYWLILAVFLGIGWLLYPERYPGTWDRLLLNMTGWKTNYNFEMWFLLPYSLIALTSKYIIQAIEKIGYLKSAVLTAIFYFGTCYVISRFHATILSDWHWLNLGVVYLQFVYPFTIGVVFFRAPFQWNGFFKTWQVIALMCVAITIVATIDISVTYIVYVPLMVFLFCQLSYPKWLESILVELGRKSMAMWMIHNWYCNYLFHEQVYSLKYPILILLEVVIISYLTAIPVMWITKKGLSYLKI